MRGAELLSGEHSLPGPCGAECPPRLRSDNCYAHMTLHVRVHLLSGELSSVVSGLG